MEITKEHKEFRQSQEDKFFYGIKNELVIPMSEKNLEQQDNAIKEYINNNFNKIKSVDIEDNKIIKEDFFGDIMDPINVKEKDQYVQLMNTFLTRKDKRKLSRYKGFKSFSDRIYGR